MYNLTTHRRKLFFRIPSNVSLTYQEILSDALSEPPTKNIRSPTAAIINAENNTKFNAKLTVTKEEGSISYSITYV